MIKFTGEECIYDENGRNVTTIKDFWAWAYSNLTNNTLRGTYAERKQKKSKKNKA